MCWIILESEAPTGFYMVQVVSLNLALSGEQYSFVLEDTLRSARALKVVNFI